MTITAIKAQVKNSERVSIFVDGKYCFSLTLSELLNEKLKVGKIVEENDTKRLKKLSSDGKLKQRALEWVLNRPRSVREFTDYLRRKKVEEELSNAWKEEFQSKGYLSDQTFASWLVELRRRGGKSERAVRAELFKKGVNREVVEEVTQGSPGESERLRQLVAKKRQAARYKDNPQKLVQYLARQGFHYEDIKAALE